MLHDIQQYIIYYSIRYKFYNLLSVSDYNYITATFSLIYYRVNKYNKTSLVFRSKINKERQLLMNHQVVPIDGITENDEDSIMYYPSLQK